MESCCGMLKCEFASMLTPEAPRTRKSPCVAPVHGPGPKMADWKLTRPHTHMTSTAFQSQKHDCG